MTSTGSDVTVERHMHVLLYPYIFTRIDREERSSYIMNGRKRTLASKRRFSANSSVIMCANVFMHLHSKTDYLYSHHRESLLRVVDELLNAMDEERNILGSALNY